MAGKGERRAVRPLTLLETRLRAPKDRNDGRTHGTNNHFRSSLAPADVQAVSPALASYTKNAIVEGLWNWPAPSARNRSIVTVATLIAYIQTIGMPHYFTLALDSGVTPAEL